MSPLELPGEPLNSPKPSKKKKKCPRCGKVLGLNAVLAQAKTLLMKSVNVTCQKCGHIFSISK
jgi:RNase P subunit RPR2